MILRSIDNLLIHEKMVEIGSPTGVREESRDSVSQSRSKQKIIENLSWDTETRCQDSSLQSFELGRLVEQKNSIDACRRRSSDLERGMVAPMRKGIQNMNSVPSPSVGESASKSTTAETPENRNVKFARYWSIIFLWISAVVVTANHPIIQKWSYMTNVGQGTIFSPDKYIPPTVFFWVSIGVSVSAWISIFIASGYQYLGECFHWHSLLWVIPSSVGLAISDFASILALQSLSAVIFSVISQSRLLLTTVIMHFIFKRQATLLQWSISYALSFSVVGFVLLSSQVNSNEISLVGVLLALLYSFGSVLYAVWLDWIAKCQHQSVLVQLAQLRLVATVLHGLGMVVYYAVTDTWHFGLFGGPYGGWDYRVVLLVLFCIIRDWVYAMVLTFMDASWKAVAAACAVSFTYLEDLTLTGNQRFNPGLFCLVISVIINVASYALSRVASTIRPKQSKVRPTAKPRPAFTAGSKCQ